MLSSSYWNYNTGTKIGHNYTVFINISSMFSSKELAQFRKRSSYYKDGIKST